jgi:hypothetical protein
MFPTLCPVKFFQLLTRKRSSAYNLHNQCSLNCIQVIAKDFATYNRILMIHAGWPDIPLAFLGQSKLNRFSGKLVRFTGFQT